MKPTSIKEIKVPRDPIVRNCQHKGRKQETWLNNRKMHRACNNMDLLRFSGIIILQARNFRRFHCRENQYLCKSPTPIWLEIMEIANPESQETLAARIMETDWCVMMKTTLQWLMMRASQIPRLQVLTLSQCIRGSQRAPKGQGLQRNQVGQGLVCPIR